eukprot:jgi/Chrzof1/463/Cz01g16220.t1
MTEYKLQERSELRLEAGADSDVFVTLQCGGAEVFGSELTLRQRMNLRGQKVAVFTWEGCTLLVEGQPNVVYVAEETPMVSYINTHQVINNLRTSAQQSGGQGPRVMVVGPTDSGKSTLCKMLLNWAVRMGSQPTYVDIDVGQGSITCPGCLAATPIEVPIDIEEGYPIQVPLVYYYGNTSPADAPELYKFLLERLSSVLDRRAERSPEVAAAGMVINAFGWFEGLGHELLLYAIQSMKVDVVVVMEQDRLYSQLSSQTKSWQGSMGRSVEVVKLNKSGGVVDRDTEARKTARVSRVHEYFYGVQDSLSPASTTVRVEDLRVFKIGGGFRAPSSALPLGATSKLDPLKVTSVMVTLDMMHTLLAVSHAQTPDQLVSANIAGFVLVTNVDVEQSTVTYLAPCAGPLPGRYLLMGSFKVYLQ